MGNVGRRRVYYLIIAAGIFSAVWLVCVYVLPARSQKQESAEYLREVLAQGDSSQSRAVAASKLGEMRDEDSMPALFRAMDDPDPLIRGRAAAAVRKIMGANYFFRATDSPERRKEVIDRIKKDWEGYLRYKNRQPAASSDGPGPPQ